MKDTKERYAVKRWPLFGIVLFVGLSSAFSPDNVYKGNEIRSVMLDAGHGGTDPGNLGTGRYKMTEKDVTLNVTRMVGKYIEDNIGDVEVHYTRKGDTYPELHERTKMANRLGVDLFVSIHCDAFTKETASGCGSYVMGTAKTAANLRMAQKENAAMLKEVDYEKNYAGFNPYSPESYIELSLRQNAFQDQSLSFSEKVQRQFRERVGRKDRGVKQAPYWVISFTTMPSVLIELGFLTNKSEEDFLLTSQGQEYMASAIYRAFKEYKAEIEGRQYVPPAEDVIIASPVINEEAVAKAGPKDEGSVKKDEIVYCIQLASASAPVDRSPENFKGLTGVSEYRSGGLYKYTYGKVDKYKKTTDLMDEVKRHGYTGCFVIALKNGKRMDLGEAMRTE